MKIKQPIDYSQLCTAYEVIDSYHKTYLLVHREFMKRGKPSVASPVLLSFGVERALKAVLKYHDLKPLQKA